MITQIINIGLEVSEVLKAKGVNVSAKNLMRLAMQTFNKYEVDCVFKYVSKEKNGGYEPMIKVYVKSEPINLFLAYNISKKLKQDCISFYNIKEGKGYLQGPSKQNWGGTFNKQYFQF